MDQRSLEMTPNWPSLKALLRDLNNLQIQNQALSEQTWRSGSTIQQLTVQINQSNANLAEAAEVLNRTREGVDQQRVDLEDEREQHLVAKKSLDYEFSKHAETEKDLAHAKNIIESLMGLIDRFDLSSQKGDADVTFPGDLKLGSLLKENTDVKRDLEAKCAQLERNERMLEEKNITIRTMEEDRNNALENLEQKEMEVLDLKAELYQFCSDDEVEFGTAVLGKRKRVENESQ